MKKLTALMLSSAMMMSLAACGGSASTETVSSEAASSEAVSTEEAASADAAAVTTVNAGKLTMSTNAAFPPYEMTTDAGDFEGIDIEVAGAIAKKLGLELQVDDMDFDAALLAVLKAHEIDLVVLAGFLSVLGPSVIEAYPRRILNVHPALIPSFCGPGMYGLRPHEAALARGCKVTGATVHFVNEECDGGPILLQKAVDILPGDTPEVLQKRVMEQAEWKLLPKAVAMVCNGEIK